jgi:hypothetical protein
MQNPDRYRSAIGVTAAPMTVSAGGNMLATALFASRVARLTTDR